MSDAHGPLPGPSQRPGRGAPKGARNRALAGAALSAVALAAVGAGFAPGAGPMSEASVPYAMARDASAPEVAASPGPYLVVLGIAQDGGYPQAGMKESPAWEDHSLRRLVASLGVVDPGSGRRWLIEATPDFKDQLHRLDRQAPVEETPGLAGIFLTHGHMGHYTGLLHLGREAMGARRVPVYAMPRMAALLRGNAPWELLVRLEHIELRPLAAGVAVELAPGLRVTPFEVPHRDEYTETVGFLVQGPRRAALFLPDIDKWERWDEQGQRIESWIERVDIAYLDGTFFADGEVPGRSMAEIPHPFIEESLRRFSALPEAERRKVRFIHLNRTNPALDPAGAAVRRIEEAGMAVARELELEPL
jgi:pyrroloquinoline quinone biosynthesis protein B